MGEVSDSADDRSRDDFDENDEHVIHVNLQRLLCSTSALRLQMTELPTEPNAADLQHAVQHIVKLRVFISSLQQQSRVLTHRFAQRKHLLPHAHNAMHRPTTALSNAEANAHAQDVFRFVHGILPSRQQLLEHTRSIRELNAVCTERELLLSEFTHTDARSLSTVHTIPAADSVHTRESIAAHRLLCSSRLDLIKHRVSKKYDGNAEAAAAAIVEKSTPASSINTNLITAHDGADSDDDDNSARSQLLRRRSKISSSSHSSDEQMQETAGGDDDSEQLTDDVIDLALQLKLRLRAIGSALHADSDVLKDADESLDSSLSSLRVQNSRLRALTANACRRMCTSYTLYAMIVIVFTLTYLLIRFVPISRV